MGLINLEELERLKTLMPLSLREEKIVYISIQKEDTIIRVVVSTPSGSQLYKNLKPDLFSLGFDMIDDLFTGQRNFRQTEKANKSIRNFVIEFAEVLKKLNIEVVLEEKEDDFARKER